MEAAGFLVGRDRAVLSVETGDEDKLFASQRIENTALSELTFKHCTFSNVSFLGTKLKQVRFENCVFIECYLRDTTFDDCVFKACKFIGSDMRKAKLIGSDFKFYNEFHGCTVSYSEIRPSLPGEPNLKAHLCDNLADQSKLAGYVRDAGQFRRAAAVAQTEHLWSAVRGSSQHYKTKFRGWNRWYAFTELIALKARGLLWGHAHPFWVVLRNWLTLALVVFPALFMLRRDEILFADASAHWYDAWFVSLTQLLPGTGIAKVEFTATWSRVIAAAESATGLLFAGITVSLLFRAVSERWRT